MGDAPRSAYRQYPEDWNGGCVACGVQRTGRIPRVLSIAGTDPTGGAGVKADLKSFSAHGAYGMAVVTALVSQNTRGVRDVHVPPVEFLRSQLDAVSDDVAIDAVKIGMLFDAPIIAEVADWLDALRSRNAGAADSGATDSGDTAADEGSDAEFLEGAPSPIVVLDPVMVATSGDRLLKPEAEEALRGLLRHVDLVTPNIPELAVLAGTQPATTPGEALDQAHAVAAEHDVLVLAKGGHLRDDVVVDSLVRPDGSAERFTGPRIDTRNTHGTGCSISAAIAALWPRIGDPFRSVGVAKEWLTSALRHADELEVGEGNGPVHHFAQLWERGLAADAATIADQWWESIADLREAIDDLDFVKGLGSGTLPQEAFRRYLAQDALYLNGYSRALAAASSLAPTQEEQMFWSYAAHGALAGEMELHRSFLGDDAGDEGAGAIEASPVTRAYVDHLVATAARGSYGELIAAVLPCFWLYRDIGHRLIARNHDAHPYARWLDTYADDAFDSDTNRAIDICSKYATTATTTERAAMDRAFRLSSWHEVEFFADPLRG
ncbi:bifunctional hydroxymethylpyrimidine kinase/phosphomethylpyrimidine kinase [Corynebacterium hansenii]|uniref:Bifunctional hydroxymethylpyrimidine kinase/phosphomethylpyrimidine kinase n=1 Tax=Corynebacterium hansenii TaxID=394964 RepID=A0ABV7ZP31_9CORY|nr:bifunctional hydroxymethylpyrimidine kinase/phosphomethylpyrimidine kinase [Corynebacterium hansenii]WJZ00503.1 Hydroxymethylpyrimidine/phosphomethylpyrimidine kinase [Corynebacterium hansenii]